VNNPDRVDELVAELTLGEKCAMVSGSDAWSIPGCERLGIPAWRVSDGPVGVRGRAMIPSLLLPSPSAMAATSDVDLVEALVDERTLREVYLRPFEAAVTETNGRAVMAAYNFVNGEHACSSVELLHDVLKREWGFDGIVVSDWGAMKETVAPARAGLDVEMPGPAQWWGDGELEAAVRTGIVDEAMVDDKVRRILSFLAWRGRLPGATTTDDERSVDREEHRALVRRAAAEGMVLLRNDGLLPLDPAQSVALIGAGAAETALQGGGSAGLLPHASTTLAEALAERWDAPVTVAPGVRLRRSVPSVPESWIGTDGVTVELYEGIGFAGEPVRVEHHATTNQVWYGDLCPPGIRTLSVRMHFSLTPVCNGVHRIMGVALHRARLFVDGELVVTNDDGFRAGLGRTCGSTELMLVGGRPYDVVLESTPPAADGMTVAVVDVGIEEVGGSREEMLVEAERAAAAAEVAVVVVGSTHEWESEGQDRADLALPAGQDELVRRVVAANPRTVAVLNCGAPTLLPWLDEVPAALLVWYPGQEGGEAIVDVLLGDAEPCGRMPTTWPRAERDTPSFLHYPGEAGVVRYGEELHVGYRWYDARGIEPRVAFGHGGSYTNFEWGDPSVDARGADVVVEVPVQNVGSRRGSDVVQVYVAQRAPVALRPPKQLAGLAKVHLDPGQMAVARVVVLERAFSRWDVTAHGWVVDPGTYELVLAASAADERFRLTHEIGALP
jgi:beta-glucosidase